MKLVAVKVSTHKQKQLNSVAGIVICKSCEGSSPVKGLIRSPVLRVIHCLYTIVLITFCTIVFAQSTTHKTGLLITEPQFSLISVPLKISVALFDL